MTKTNKNMNGGRRMAKTKTRGVGTNTAIVTSKKVVDLGTATSGGFCYSGARLDPLNSGIVTIPVAAIAGAYEFYRLIAAKVTCIPTGGSQAPGSYQCAFLGNPEIAAVYDQAVLTLNNTVCSQIITNEEGAESFTLQAMSSKTMGASRVLSRRWYSCNLNGTGTVDYDRSVAAYYAFAARGVTPSVSVNARVQFELTYEFRGLGTSQLYTFLGRELADPAEEAAKWTYRVNYSPEDGADWPSAVDMGTRTSEHREYVLKVLEPKPE